MKKITLSQLFRYGSLGFLSMIALPSSLLTSPALSSELSRTSQNQQPSSTETLAADNLVAQSAPLTAQEIQNRLVGQWQFQDIFFVPVTLVFTAQGRGFVLVPFFGPNPNTNPTAYEFSYQINNTTQPFQVDIAQPGEAPIKTIFEFTNDGRIRVELAGIKPNEPRPTEFTAGSSLLSRVSNLTTLPRNTEIANSLEARTRSKEGQGRNLVGSLLNGQQSYFLEKETFTTDIKELGTEIEDSPYEDYTLQIVPSGNLRQSVFVTATAKTAGLRSFIGAVFVVKEGEENTTIIGFCETIEPSLTPPAPPTLIATQSNHNLMHGSLSAARPKFHEFIQNAKQVQCAPGSRPPEVSRNRNMPGLF